MLRFVLRQLAATRGAMLTLGAVVLVAALVLSAAPRAVARLHDAQAAWTVGETTPLTRDLLATAGGALPADWDRFGAGLTALRDAQPEPLRGRLGEPDFQVTATEQDSVTPLPDSDLFSIVLDLRATRHLADHAALVEGRWPGATAVPPEVSGIGDTPGVPSGADGDAGHAGDHPIEVAVSRQAADRFGWEAGGEYELRTSGSSLAPLSSRGANGWGPLVVTGVYEQTGDPRGSWWRQNPIGGVPNVVQDPNTGLNAEAAAYVDPAMIDPLSWGDATTTAWIPVSGEGLAAAQVPGVLAQLRGVDARENVVDDGAAGIPLHLDSDLPDVLADLLARRAGVDAVIAVLAAGPLGAAVAVLALGARLVVDRRRPALALLRARGASDAQVRALAGAEGAAVGLVAAAAGFVIGTWAVPGQVTVAQAGLAVAAGLAPGVTLALATGPRGLAGARSDLGRGRGRARRILEVIVLAGAAVSTALLVRRGVVAGAAEADGDTAAADGAVATGVDPLLAASPLLLALAVTVLAVRLFPVVARVAERALGRRSDLVPFLGTARALRDPAGGVVPAIALVLCVSVVATAAVLHSTVAGGVTREAWREVGADLRVSGPEVTDDVARDLARIDGVAAVAPVTDHDRIVVGLPDGSGVRATLYTTDTRAMERAQRDVSGALRDLGALGGAGDGTAPVPVAVTASTGLRLGQEIELRLSDAPVAAEVAEVVEQVPGLPDTEVLVLADTLRLATVVARHEAEEEGTTASGTGAADPTVVSGSVARTALLALDDGGLLAGGDAAPASGVVDAVHGVLPHAVVDDPEAAAREILAAPASSGLAAAFVIAVVLAALLSGAVLVTALLLAAPGRARLLAVLRTLGLTGRQGRGLVGWEIAPWLVVALVAGAVLGVVVPAVLLAAVDVTPLTGGERQPAVRWDPLLLLGLAAGLVAVAAAAVGIASWAGRRHGIATELRIGEER